MFYCAYDKEGNLFTDGLGSGIVFAELPNGSKTFKSIALALPKSATAPGGLQWANKYLATAAADGDAIYEYRIDGERAMPVHSTPLNGLSNGSSGLSQFWIVGGTAVAPGGTVKYPKGLVGFFRYPAGGKPTKLVTGRLDNPWAVTVSPART
jgi:hypothetical protein